MAERSPYLDDLIKEVKTELEKRKAKTGGRIPQVLVIGLWEDVELVPYLCREAGIPDTQKNLVNWDLPETMNRPGPYAEIRKADVNFRQLHLSKRQGSPPFIPEYFLKEGKRNLGVVCDVSCDATNPHNPIPFCNQATYFNKPTISVSGFTEPPLSYITIDHLPSLLPRGMCSLPLPHTIINERVLTAF
ncbi:hypothetical protein OEA41_002551 [Lepraria neglecta]|uniref:Uncharacterized protein n=1 Tax=Lepraria neglecta TaxID=209136 RepID=A0AAE0DMC2_9LECA|nr:hypothetical protein OEA41_002551 [Lepraria neglecta]